MYRTNRDNAIRFESLEQALANNPETYGHIDILCAGWPCQDNSSLGKRKGLEGSQSGLWHEVCRLLALFRPGWFVGENVCGLFSVRNGKDFWRIISDLDTLGYCVAWRVLDTQFFGLSQRRKRIFIVGSLGNTNSTRVLCEQESSSRNFEKKQKGTEFKVLSAHDGYRNDFKTDNLIAYTVRTDVRGSPYRLWTENLVAQTYADRKGKIAGISSKLDTRRGIVIGNAVSVPVAEWIGKRIVEVEQNHLR